ncbi:hypothetical protein B0H16DRAFT_1688067 [Mycena metata]|uniref:Uncharacterized protein n=1 Tax=Mycena metata TaxID=1033252 RepID=A0AAD7JG66_9AGAR|nr:hypothetical protein B0H16DRAFT_1688067 [Mycena metata]
MPGSPRKHRYTLLRGDAELSVEVLKSTFIDIIQSHQQYYDLTSQNVCGGSLKLHSSHFRVNKNEPRSSGIIVNLDRPPCSDPVLLVAEKRKPEPLADEVRRELSLILIVLYARVLAQSSGAYADLSQGDSFLKTAIWNAPGPFKPKFSSIVNSWLIPLWRLLGDEQFVQGRPHLHSLKGRMTYATVMDLISKDVGCGELALRAALRVPLPPPQVDELAVLPPFRCLIHIGTASDFERAIVDIAQAVTHFSEAYPQHASTPLGFLLDLDPLEQCSSLSTVVGPHQDQPSRRFGPYDLISSPSSAKLNGNNKYPRHALESLFYSLVWFTQAKVFGESGGIRPRSGGEWLYYSAASNLPQDHAASRYEGFVMQRRAFLMDWKTYMPFKNMEPGVKQGCSIVERWLVPLWKIIGDAHFFSRWREGEPGYDWQTLGGGFTPEKFMAILQAPGV